jgi:hypothetical protein
MAKVNFTKVENAFDKALQKLLIDHLSELAAIANVIQDPQTNLSSKTIEDIIIRFQKELKKLKKKDPKLYERLNLSPEDELRFALPFNEFMQEDWFRLKNLKVRIDELKHELYGQESLDAEYEKQVSKERRRHINKRFNIRDGWLPLH